MNQNNSIEALEKDYWPDLDKWPTGLVQQSYLLRKKPLKNFTIEDLRLMIGQNIGLPYLIPLAIAALEKNILAEGDYYKGDLLYSTLRSDQKYWQEHTKEKKILLNIVKSNIQALQPDIGKVSIKAILRSVKEFEEY